MLTWVVIAGIEAFSPYKGDEQVVGGAFHFMPMDLFLILLIGLLCFVGVLVIVLIAFAVRKKKNNVKENLQDVKKDLQTDE